MKGSVAPSNIYLIFLISFELIKGFKVSLAQTLKKVCIIYVSIILIVDCCTTYSYIR